MFASWVVWPPPHVSHCSQARQQVHLDRIIHTPNQNYTYTLQSAWANTSITCEHVYEHGHLLCDWLWGRRRAPAVGKSTVWHPACLLNSKCVERPRPNTTMITQPRPDCHMFVAHYCHPFFAPWHRGGHSPVFPAPASWVPSSMGT